MIDCITGLVVWDGHEGSFPNQELVNEALMMAVEQPRPKPSLIHHSDYGVLYSSGSYLELLKSYPDAAAHEWQGQLL
jgi:transposase InsO family protein